ncbi:MAG: YHS domain-containing (seleno)protein [Nevskiales bacterium]
MKMKKFAIYGGCTLVILAALAFAGLKHIGMFASEPILTSAGLAAGGYDPVAYFTENKPVKGQESISLDWGGARWAFVNGANRDQFATDPARYAPQFGGYCAYAIAHGYTAKGDPLAWSVVDDKLYLNYDVDTRTQWLASKKQFIADAQQNWPSVLR